MSSESSSVEMPAVNDKEDNEVKADQQQSEAAAAAAAMKIKNRRMVRLDDRYVRRLQRLPPIKPLTVSESLLQAFPNFREVLRHADAQVNALIEIEADISRQFHEEGFAELDEALLSPALLN